jgi:urease
VQPFVVRPMWGALPGSTARNSVPFVSAVSIASGTVAGYGLTKRYEAVRGCRKADMKRKRATPRVMVDPEMYEVHADGVLTDVAAAEVLPLGRVFNLF